MPTDLSQLPQLVESLSTVAAVLERLGIPGLLLLVVSGPAAVILALMLFNHANAKSLTQMHEQARRDMQDIVTQMRMEMNSIIEAYRADTQHALSELGENQRTTAQFYKDNVELVKGYKRMADDFSDLIVSNTAALHRIAGLVENNMNCPAVRETVRGKK